MASPSTPTPHLAPGEAAVRRPDASMDLLNHVRETALDPAYVAAATSAGGTRRRSVRVLAAMLAVGLLVGITVANQLRTVPAAARERTELITRITQAEATHDSLRDQVLALQGTNRDLEQQQAALDPADASLRDLLQVATGQRGVSGPGLRVRLDDGSDTTVRGSRVVDSDLRMVVNALWGAGAEAVAVNGHRLSTRTPIRNAGDAITVDYRSLTRPYLVEAVGDPALLEQSYLRSEGGRWVMGLGQHYGVVSEVARVKDLALDADPGLDTNHARRAR